MSEPNTTGNWRTQTPGCTAPCPECARLAAQLAALEHLVAQLRGRLHFSSDPYSQEHAIWLDGEIAAGAAVETALQQITDRIAESAGIFSEHQTERILAALRSVIADGAVGTGEPDGDVCTGA